MLHGLVLVGDSAVVNGAGNGILFQLCSNGNRNILARGLGRIGIGAVLSDGGLFHRRTVHRYTSDLIARGGSKDHGLGALAHLYSLVGVGDRTAVVDGALNGVGCGSPDGVEGLGDAVGRLGIVQGDGIGRPVRLFAKEQGLALALDVVALGPALEDVPLQSGHHGGHGEDIAGGGGVDLLLGVEVLHLGGNARGDVAVVVQDKVLAPDVIGGAQVDDVVLVRIQVAQILGQVHRARA